MSVLTGLFNLLALLYIGRAVQLAVQISRNWSELRQEPLTGAKQRLAEQAAFFLGVPPAVLVHELAHAIAVVVFGGRVAEFGYRVFWGYVVPQGSFSAVQNWIIAIAGTLGSLAFGAGLWFLLRRNAGSPLRYFGLRAFRFQIYFSLLYYPIFSLFLPIGDWRVIYDFTATPILSAVAGLAHALSLAWFWRADRAGWFEMAARDPSVGRMGADPAAAGGEAAQLAAIVSLWSGGARQQAHRALRDFLAAHPHSAEGQLQLALMSGNGYGQVSRRSLAAAERALELGLSEPDHIALARQLIALYYLERGDGQAAERQANAALTPVGAYDPERLPPLRRAELHHLRSQAYRRQQRYGEAYAESGIALDLAQALGAEPYIRKYQDEKDLIVSHAGPAFSVPSKEGTSLT